MKDWFQPNKIGDYIGSLAIMAVFFTGIIIFWRTAVIPSNTPNTDITNNIVDVVQCPADFKEFASTSKKLDILTDKQSNGYKGKLKGYNVTLERGGITSEVVCGYLFYQVSFNGKPIEKEYMSLVMLPTGSKLGGHIIPNESRGAIIDVLSDRTQVLMPLDSITYDGVERNPIREINWAPLLNVGRTIEFQIALSAATPTGMINRVQLAYKCVNKETRKENDVCDIKVTETQPFGF